MSDPVKFTPGPWKAVRASVCEEIEMMEIADISHMRVVPAAGGWPTPGTPEDDARLMAAAPDLLLALQMLYAETADYIQLNKLGGIDNQCMKLARAALAKATEDKP